MFLVPFLLQTSLFILSHPLLVSNPGKCLENCPEVLGNIIPVFHHLYASPSSTIFTLQPLKQGLSIFVRC